MTSPRRFENTLWLVLFTLYVGGLLVWLGLGLIPPLTEAVPPLEDLIVWLADTRTPLAGTARRVLENAPDLPHPGLFISQYLFSIINLSLGLLLALRLPHDVVPRLLAVALIGTAATFNQPSHVVYSMIGQPLPVKLAHTSFHVVSGVAYLLAVVLFPDGRLPRSVRIGRSPALALVRDLTVALVALALYRTRLQEHTKLLVVFFGVVVPIAGVVAQTVRIRSDRTPNLQRRQSRLLRAALVPALVVAVAWLVVRGTGWFANDRSAAGADDVVRFVFPMVFAVVPVVLLATILKYRLWDVDVLLSRAVLILLVGVLVALTYAVAVGAAGTVFRGRGWSAALAVVVIAVVVEPVARRCEHLANRLVFGQELTPRQAMHALSDRLSRPDASSELTELTRILVAGTRCSSAAVWLVLPETLVLATAHPEGRADRLIRVPRQRPEMQDVVDAFPGATCIPVTYEHDLIAAIVLTLPAGVTLPAPEARLIQDLARQAGLLVANARLTAALAREVERVQASAAELRRSREHVVVAQDGERRRLERDIHDGAQQELVALLIELGTAERTLTAQGALQSDQIQHLEGGVAAAVPRSMSSASADTLACSELKVCQAPCDRSSHLLAGPVLLSTTGAT